MRATASLGIATEVVVVDFAGVEDVTVFGAIIVEAITHRKPWTDFLHWYLIFFDVRKIPACAHFAPVICDAVLDEDGKAISNNDVQMPTAKPRRLFIA